MKADFFAPRWSLFCCSRLNVRAKFPAPLPESFCFVITSLRDSRIPDSCKESFFFVVTSPRDSRIPCSVAGVLFLFQVFAWEPNFPLLSGVFILFFVYFTCQVKAEFPAPRWRSLLLFISRFHVRAQFPTPFRSFFLFCFYFPAV